MLGDDYVVLSTYRSRSSVGVSLLIECSLNADIDLVLADDGCRLVVADVAVKSFEFRVAVAEAVSGWQFPGGLVAEAVSFFRWLAPFVDDPQRIVLVGDWNAILDTKINKVGRVATGLGSYESSLVDFMAHYDLVDWFRQEHTGREI